jgi:hypothetical protein
MPFMTLGGGVATHYGTLLPPSTSVAAFVRSTGAQDGDSIEIQRNLVTTLASALDRCRANRGDVIYLLPGHSESVVDGTMLDNLKVGTKIVGIGRGSDMPVFRWTAAAASWAINDANVEISGVRLRMEGANGITKAINITAADVALAGCDIEVASGATAKAAIAIEVGSAALRCSIVGSVFRGTTTHNVTDGIKLVGGTVPSGFRLIDNEMIFSATAANGLVHVTVAALGILIARNFMYNTHTASTACIAIDDVAADGLAAFNALGTLNDGVAADQGITFGTAALVKCVENYSIDEPKKSGALAPAAAAT